MLSLWNSIFSIHVDVSKHPLALSSRHLGLLLSHDLRQCTCTVAFPLCNASDVLNRFNVSSCVCRFPLFLMLFRAEVNQVIVTLFLESSSTGCSRCRSRKGVVFHNPSDCWSHWPTSHLNARQLERRVCKEDADESTQKSRIFIQLCWIKIYFVLLSSSINLFACLSYPLPFCLSESKEQQREGNYSALQP